MGLDVGHQPGEAGLLEVLIMSDDRILEKLDKIEETVAHILATTVRLDERSVGTNERLRNVERGYNKAGWALLTSLLAIVGTSGLALLQLLFR